MDALTFLNFYIVPGLVTGSIYALGAIGITLIFGVLRYAHLAHGDMATLGAFIALACVQILGISVWAALPIAIAVTAAVAVGLDRAFYSHLRARPMIMTVMASLGVALMIRAAVQMIWGADPEVFQRGITRPNAWLRGEYGLRIKDREMIIFGVMIALVIGTALFLKVSKWGKAMRAMSDNPTLARLSGVNTQFVVTLTWIIAGGLCAVAGVALGVNTELKSMMGWHMLLPMFAAAILGGVGRVDGAVLGGLIVGLAEEFAPFLFSELRTASDGMIDISNSYKAAFAFVLLILTLLLRPRGLLKGKVL